MAAGDMSADALLCLWAKLPRDKTAHSYHPLICHLLDVSMVTRLLWADVLSRSTRWRISAALQLDEDTAGRWIAFWSGAHDIGKGCPAFQLRDVTPAELRERIEAAGLDVPKQSNRVNHGAVSTYELEDGLQDDYHVPSELAFRVALSVGGHHGTFPNDSDLSQITGASTVIHGGASWRAARRLLLAELARQIDLPYHDLPQRMGSATAMWLAGFVSVADWIGSNEDFFRHKVPDVAHPPHVDVAAYRDEALATARKALRQLGWLGGMSPAQVWSFSALFPKIKVQAPVQQAVVALAEVNVEPALVIVEAPMGEGKTEAALYLADHWDALLGQHGFYVALPTQATSNQMYGRVRAFLENRYKDDATDGNPANGIAVLQLLHGHAALSGEFESLLRDGDKVFSPRGINDDGDHAAKRPDVVAGEWFTYKKRGLLSPFGVGTIDQSLLAVLGTRHVFVRLFGLAGKVVIVDEVHAYDTYMSELLERLLCWLGALGCSVVLLSATLPRGRRERLLRAYRRGTGDVAATGESATPLIQAGEPAPYPRVTWVPAAPDRPIVMKPVETSERSRKAIRVECIDGRLPAARGEPFALGQKLQRALADGGCAAVICNTVRRARQVYRALQRYFPGMAADSELELSLLHARYPFEERDRREKQALVRFGKEGETVETAQGSKTVFRPWRAVLVTTQIVEQSLDLDFDLMVTDLAPVDLILQRTGRLWRHDRCRPPGLTEPALWLCEPETTQGRPDFGPSAYVYDAHVLLRSWYHLRPIIADGKLSVPEQVEDLVENVYKSDDVECPANVASIWGDYWAETRKKQRSHIAEEAKEARKRYIRPPDDAATLDEIVVEAREEDAPHMHPSLQAVTRLALPSVPVVLLRGSEHQPCLVDREGTHIVDLRRKPDMHLTKRLLKQAVTASGFWVVERLLQREVPLGWQESALLRNHRYVVLDADDRTPVGDYTLWLHPEEGVIVSKGPEIDEIDEEKP